MTQSAEELARGLTKRERLDLRRYARGSSSCKTSMRRFVEAGIVGFTDEAGIKCDNLTPLGLRVAALLKEE